MVPLLSVGSGSGAYPVYLARGVVAQLSRLVDDHCQRGLRFALVSGTVARLHASRLEQALAGFEVIPVDDDEERKTLRTAESMIDALLAKGARRDSVVVSIGGGMVGDTVGFAASILLRGVDLVHVPTTLLAQVDSSIGGKNGVNHQRGKNLIGSFWPPRAVVSDPEFLDTLPESELRSGLFEAMKGGVIGDPALFEATSKNPADFEEIVRRAIEVKARIVSDDERERGDRRLLNYGHTIGHGIESALDYRGITHGEAVAWGMIGANAIAVARGALSQAERERIDGAIRALEPRPAREATPERVRASIGLDKKFTADRRVMVLPRRVGECVVADDITAADLDLGIAAALSSRADQRR